MANAWTLLVRLQADARQMEYALSSVDRQMGGLSQKIGGFGRAVSATGRAMTIGLTAPVVGLGGAAVKAAADWESSFTSIEKVLSDVDMEKAHMTFEQLERDLRDLAKAIPIEGGVNALAEVAAQGGALGIAAPRIVEFTEVVAKLSQTADDISMDSAARSLGHLNTVMNFSEGEINAFADAVVHLGNNGASTEGEILNMASAIAGAAAIAEIGQQDTVAWAAAMANVGEKAQAGGSSLSRFFQNMHGFITGGTEELEVIAGVMGTTQEAVQAAFGEDSSQFLVDFLTELSKVKDEWIPVLEAIGLGDLLRRRGFTRMLEAIRQGSSGSIVAMIEELNNAEGAMDVEFAKRVDTLNAKLQIIGQRLYEAAITAGETLIPIIEKEFLPILDEAIEKVQEIADWFSALPEDTKKTIIQVGLLVAAAGPLLMVFGGVFQFLGLIIGSVQSLGGLLGGIVGTLGGLGRAVGGGTGTIARVFAQPVFVTNWPPGMLAPGGPGAGPLGPITGGGGWKGFLGRIFGIAGRLFGLAFVAVAGFEIGKMIGNFLIEDTVAPARDFETSAFDRLLSTGSMEEIANGISVIKENLNPDDFGARLALALDAGGVRTTLEGQLAQLEALYGEMKLNTGERAGTADAIANMAADAAAADANLLALHERNLPKLASSDVIRELAATTEMGLKGVGTSFQVGLTTGLDPVGDTATAILRRAEDPLAPEVMYEIQGHLNGLEEIQQTYLDNGDVKLAEKVQNNIDTLHELIGTVDAHNAVAEWRLGDAATADANMLAWAATQTDLLRQIRDKKMSVAVYNSVTGVGVGTGGQGQPNFWTDHIILGSGAWNLREDTPAQLHKGEMVVPAPFARDFRKHMGMMGTNEASMDGGNTYHVEVQGLLPVRSVRDIGSELRMLGDRGILKARKPLRHERQVTMGGKRIIP